MDRRIYHFICIYTTNLGTNKPYSSLKRKSKPKPLGNPYILLKQAHSTPRNRETLIRILETHRINPILNLSESSDLRSDTVNRTRSAPNWRSDLFLSRCFDSGLRRKSTRQRSPVTADEKSTTARRGAILGAEKTASNALPGQV